MTQLGEGTPLTWGAGVKSRRIGKGWQQADLAEAAGFSQAHISRIENGSREISDAGRVRIARALGADPHELFPYSDAAEVAS